MTAERDWDEAFAGLCAGLVATTASCRHCRERIHRMSYQDGAKVQWEDELGITVCAKARIPDFTRPPGEQPAVPPVCHEPMPAGLGGAPG
jgi:hypothetical protein